MKEMDAYIALRGSANVFETSDLPSTDVQTGDENTQTCTRLAGQSDQVVCTALAHALDGPAGKDEHRKV